VPEGGAGGPRSRDRSLLNTVIVVKAKSGRVRRRGSPESR